MQTKLKFFYPYHSLHYCFTNSWLDVQINKKINASTPKNTNYHDCRFSSLGWADNHMQAWRRAASPPESNPWPFAACLLRFPVLSTLCLSNKVEKKVLVLLAVSNVITAGVFALLVWLIYFIMGNYYLISRSLLQQTSTNPLVEIMPRGRANLRRWKPKEIFCWIHIPYMEKRNSHGQRAWCFGFGHLVILELDMTIFDRIMSQAVVQNIY